MSAAQGDRDFLAAVAGVGLGALRPSAISPGTGWGVALGRVEREQMTGLAVAGVESGELVVTEGQRDELWSSHRGAMARVVALERRLVEFASALESEAIEFIVLKGPAVAHVFYVNPALRGFRDIDVLVRTKDLERAAGVLAGLGFERDLPEPRPDFDVRFGKAICHSDPDGLQVDLHRTLVVGPFGLWMRPEELFDSTVEFMLGGRSFRRLADEVLFLHACVHAALGWRPPLLLPLRDVIAIAGAGTIDWDTAASIAGRWKLRGVVQYALDCASTMVPGAILPGGTAVVGSGRVPRRERRALASYTSARRRRGGTARTTLWAIHGPRQKLAYIRSLVLPDRSFLKARAGEGGRASLLRRWRVPLRWMTAGVRRTK